MGNANFDDTKYIFCVGGKVSEGIKGLSARAKARDAFGQETPHYGTSGQ